MTEYIVIPKADGSWVSHTLATVEGGKGLGLLSKLIGLKAWGIERHTGIAQYTNNSVAMHSRFGDLELRTALTEIHDHPDETFIYRMETDLDNLVARVNSPPERKPTFLLNPNDMAAKQELQERIEAGGRYAIIFPGHMYDGEKKPENLRIPILEL